MSIYSKQNHKSGFTLIESMISLSIVAIIASISFYGLNSYTEYFNLKDTASFFENEIKLAQSKATNIQDIQGTNKFSGRYGIKVSMDAPTEIILFSDTDPEDHLYNGGSSCSNGECVEKTIIGKGIYIKDICYTNISNTEFCSQNRLDMTFVRPRSDAYFAINGTLDSNIKEVRITIASPNDQEIKIGVGATGFITII